MPKGRDQNLSRKQHKPTILALPHPARTLGECDVCLFTKDPQREYKDKLAEQSVRAKASARMATACPRPCTASAHVQAAAP